MTRHRIAAILAVAGFALATAAPVRAANKEQQQMLADIRMLQEQAQLLQNLIGTLGTTLGASMADERAPQSSEPTAALRKTLADQKLVIDNLTNDLRVVREKVDDNNVRIGSLTQELDALRRSLQDTATRTQTVPAQAPPEAAESGGTPTAGAAPPPLAPGTSPQKIYDAAMSDYYAGQFDLAIQGFEAYLRDFPKSNVADDAQVKIGQRVHATQEQKALEAYDKAIRNYPGGKAVPDAYFQKGLVLNELKQPDQARESWAFLVKKFPDSAAGLLAKQRLEQLK